MADRYRTHPDVAWRLVDGVVFMLTPDSRYQQIDDEVGVMLWQTLASAVDPADVESLATVVAAAFDVDGATACRDVAAFLADLARVGAVERVPSEMSDTGSDG